ncbi:MAG: hypothetical protein H7Z15_22575 [Rhizobacter sp.]|nr:hypothetical protein [Rhizobacter sp.]
MNSMLWVRAALAATVGLMLAGCGAFSDTVRVNDHNSPVASVRVTVRPETWARNAESLRGIQVGYERYRAQGTQELLAGQEIRLNLADTPLPGPDRLRNDVTVAHAYLGYSHTFLFGRHLEMEPVFGLAHLRFDTQVQPTVSLLQPSMHYSKAVAFGGFTPRWRFNDLMALELRLTWSGRSLDIATRNADLGLVLRPEKRVGLRLGYSWRGGGWSADYVSSEVSVSARGPSASLLFDF